MRRLVIIALVIILNQSVGLAQSGYLSNYSVSNNLSLCNARLLDTVFDNKFGGFLCYGGNSKLYYSFSPDLDFTFGSYVNLGYTVSSSAGTQSSYTIYGPFNPGEDYVTEIATSMAPVLETGALASGSRSFTASVIANKYYIVEITVPSCSGTIQFFNRGKDFVCSDGIDCEYCIPKFQPVQGQYVVSAWIKEANNTGALTYTNSQLKVTSGSNVYTFYGSGQIIDGWQRIEGIVQTDSPGNLKIELSTSASAAYFDDIRVFPFDGSMITYVYDPVTMRLVAELDERNYAKIYEYDEEGKLIRVKKETEKGIMTIQENRENTHGN